MHRLHALGVLLSAALLACGGDKKDANDPSDKTTRTDSLETGDKDSAGGDKGKDGGGGSAENGAPKKDICVGGDIGNLEDLLAKSDCEVADKKPDSLENPDMKGKLEVTVAASPTKVAPGAKADLMVSFVNKTKEPLALHFRVDPVARFETETYDAKKKRADMPTTPTPPPPKGHSAPPPAEAKVAKVTVNPGGSARVRVPWEAVKMKWAPEKVRGTAVEKGYPRVPAGPLPKGKYSVKVDIEVGG